MSDEDIYFLGKRMINCTQEIKDGRKKKLDKINSLMNRFDIQPSQLNERIKYPVTPYGWSIEELTRLQGEAHSIQDLNNVLRMIEDLVTRK